MVNLFSFGCHVIDRASTDWTVRVRVRETQKEVRGFLANPHWQYGQLTAVKTGWPPTSTTWPYRRLMCQLIQVTWSIWKVSADHSIVLLDRDQCLISCFLASLGAQENWEWTDNVVINWHLSKQGIRWPVYLTVSRAQVSTHRGKVFFEVIRWQVNCFQMIAGSSLIFWIYLKCFVYLRHN